MYAWGTNSMGQCGQGHSTGSITLPAKVQGLEGKQIQQITAGTSHSVVWTAVPLDRLVEKKGREAVLAIMECVCVFQTCKFDVALAILRQCGRENLQTPAHPPHHIRRCQQ